MSSSGLIYAVIVGAWAAYLVPMWLRRQDELNEVRPTERFSTAIRLLSGRAGMERRAAAAHGEPGDGEDAADDARDASGDAAGAPERSHDGERAPATPGGSASDAGHGRDHEYDDRFHPAEDATRRRADLLARRRRLVTALFLAFTLGMIVSAVWGAAFLWAPLIPAVLFTSYIAYLRRQERRRYVARLEHHRAAEAPVARPARPAPPADGRAHRHAPAPEPAPAPRARARTPHDAAHAPAHAPAHGPTHAPAHAPAPDPLRAPSAAGQADPAEAPAQPPAAPAHQSHAPAHAPAPAHGPAAPEPAPAAPRPAAPSFADVADQDDDPEGWDPVPVPLPTYVTAPVAPRNTGSLDLGAPDAWTSGRGADPASPAAPPSTPPAPPARRPRTPLFDQYADDPRPAANQ